MMSEFCSKNDKVNSDTKERHTYIERERERERERDRQILVQTNR